MREAALQALTAFTGLSRSELEYKLHVRCTGSYLRGKADCGDIDLLVAAPPQVQRVRPSELATAILKSLKDAGYAKDSLSASHMDDKDGNDRATWIGVWKGPSSPVHRRMDILVYPFE